MKTFFVSCPIGMESDVLAELQEFWPHLINLDGRQNCDPLKVVSHHKGGIEIEVAEVLGFQINYFSRLASRVLMRIGEFKTTQFPVLEKRLKALDITGWIGSKEFQLKISSSKSKLGNEKRILQTAEKVWGKKINKEAKMAIYIRFEADLATISLDTSGEHLHLRGGHEFQSQAPIRSNIAARMVREIVGRTPFYELKKLRLIDPMAGSGTILFEAYDYFKPNTNRDFNFLHFIGGPKILASKSFFNNFQISKEPLMSEIVGFDISPEAQEAFLKNKGERKINFSVQNALMSPPLPGRNWLLMNPPYGERLPQGFTWSQLMNALDAAYHPERIGFIAPLAGANERPSALADGTAFKLKFKINHGGLMVGYYQASRSKKRKEDFLPNLISEVQNNEKSDVTNDAKAENI